MCRYVGTLRWLNSAVETHVESMFMSGLNNRAAIHFTYLHYRIDLRQTISIYR